MQQPNAARMAILDWMMPQMDGLTVIRKVREQQTDQPSYLIMLTAKGEKTDIIVGLDAGADDYLVKPFDAGELRARIEVGRRLLNLQQRLAEKVQDLLLDWNDIGNPARDSPHLTRFVKKSVTTRDTGIRWRRMSASIPRPGSATASVLNA